MKNTEWRQFEHAVANFISAIAPDARITHDVIVPDIHTGHPRQRDVWVEWAIAGHFPAKALISCKYWSTKLDQSDIDHFNGEYLSSGAQIGIVYSKSGFNDRALAKAKVLNFHCCRLFADEPARIPDHFTFGAAYLFKMLVRFTLQPRQAPSGFQSWKNMLSLPTRGGTVLEEFNSKLAEIHKLDASNRKERWHRAASGKIISINVSTATEPPAIIEISMKDQVYLSKIDYSLVNGSYNITANSFFGSKSTPFISIYDHHPGEGWTEIDTIPLEIPPATLTLFEQSYLSDAFLDALNSFERKE